MQYLALIFSSLLPGTMVVNREYHYRFLFYIYQFLLIFFITITFTVQAQTELLKQNLQKIEKIRLENPQFAIEQLLTIENDINQFTTNEDIARYYLELAILNQQVRNITGVKFFAEKGLAVQLEQTHFTHIKLSYLRGNALNEEQNFNESLLNFKEGINLAQSIEDYALVAEGQLYLALSYSTQHDDEQTLLYLKQAYRTAHQIDDQALYSAILSELGGLYLKMGDIKGAVNYYEEALLIDEQGDHIFNLITTLYNLGIAYIRIDNAKQAIIYFDRMLKLSRQYKQTKDLYMAYFGLALASKHLKQEGTALNYLQKSEEYLRLIKSYPLKIQHYLEKAEILHLMAQTSTAMQQISLVDELVRQFNLKLDLKLASRIAYQKAVLFSELGQYEQAYQELKNYTSIIEHKVTTDNDERLQTLRLAFDRERHENQILFLKNTNKELKRLVKNTVFNQRVVYLMSIMLLIVLGSLILLVRKTRYYRLQVTEFSTIDMLTHTFNREFLFAQLPKIIQRARENQYPLSLIKFDLDKFHHIISESGYSDGDEVLKIISELCNNELHEKDILIRMGDDQFVIILPEQSLSSASEKANIIREQFNQDRRLRYDFISSVTASFGVTELNTEILSAEQLLKQVDKALSIAQKNGRNCVEEFIR